MASSVGNQPSPGDESDPLLKNHSPSPSKADPGRPLTHTPQAPRRQLPTAIRSGAYSPICFLPLALVAGYLQWNPVLVFIYNLFAIIALSAIISDSSQQLTAQTNTWTGALINTVPCKAVGLSLGAWAVASREIYVAQSLAIGTILSEILLILGCSMIAASYRSDLLYFNQPTTNTLSSLMLATSTVLVLPSVLATSFPYELGDRTVAFSRGVSAVLLGVYAGYLYFQLGTHRHLFPRQQWTENPDEVNADADTAHDLPRTASGNAKPALVLTLATLAAIICSKFLTDTLVITAARLPLSKTLIAATLVPLATTGATGVSMIRGSAVNQEVDGAVCAVVQNVVHLGLFGMPVLVLLGWVLAKPMSLVFDVFEVVVLFFSVLLVNGVLRGGRYSVVHGVALVAMYAILTLAFCVR
ncbi:hypothetical protein BO82DRAFT_350463 [Aspergillus uvarum CBS 121591]|uniref:Sodium/calcium exchanger membrane region domain-containing protein n=1 Tax=Aspergillus uvarum CBS 121591 TaxID=1448315 RepID=A0A319CNL5_9EURO|nr:hypothetical protein BO82DRAFT_350463 [Aspergillus uvarum CBS 121591]PYH86180.1 hypothetical protein BO82DRAFT_350463 [Aspergillus uvarum CBS 121591]